MSSALANVRYETFSQLMALAVITGQTTSDCYTAVFGTEDKTPEQIKAAAYGLANRPNIKERINRIGQMALKKNELTLEITIEKALHFCAKVIMSKPSEANMDNPLCELKMSKMGPYATFPDKLTALSIFTKLKGWNQDVNISVSVPSWTPTVEENITSPAIEAEVIQDNLEYPIPPQEEGPTHQGE